MCSRESLRIRSTRSRSCSHTTGKPSRRLPRPDITQTRSGSNREWQGGSRDAYPNLIRPGANKPTENETGQGLAENETGQGLATDTGSDGLKQPKHKGPTFRSGHV